MSKLLNSPLTDLGSSFLDFKRREALAWATYMINHPWVNVYEDLDNTGYLDLTDPRCLVRPSGWLKSPLAHHFNQPTFTTAQKYDVETADPTNGCIAMVTGNAYTPETFLFIQFPRRSYIPEVTEENEFPDNVQRCHIKLTADIADSIHAKVKILYGEKVESFQLQLHSQSYSILPLWGEYKGIEFLLMHEEGYGNPDTNYKFRRVVLCYKHPQYLLKPHSNPKVNSQHDMTTKAAWLTAGGKGRISLIPNYYSEQKWKQNSPPILDSVDRRSIKPCHGVTREGTKQEEKS